MKDYTFGLGSRVRYGAGGDATRNAEEVRKNTHIAVWPMGNVEKQARSSRNRSACGSPPQGGGRVGLDVPEPARKRLLDRLGLRVRIFLFFALVAVGAIAAMVLGTWTALLQAEFEGLVEVPGLVESKVQGWLFSGFLILVLVGGIWHLFDTHVANAIDRLAHAIRTRAHADVSRDIGAEREAARYLGDLGPAASEIARSLGATRSALAESVARETARLASEKALLETLLADVPVAVLLCTADYQMVFYNGQAVSVLEAVGAPGLDRNLFDYLREGPVRHAYARLARLDDPDATSDLICTTRASGRLLSGRMRVLARAQGDRRPGFVLTLRDVTAEHAAHTAREALLAEIFDRLRRPEADLSTLRTAVAELGRRYDEGEHLDWHPLTDVRARDLMDGIAAQFDALGLALVTQAPDLMLRGDGFELALLFRSLGQRLASGGHAHSFTLRVAEEEGPGAVIDLTWQGEPLPAADLDAWLAEALDAQTPDLTARAVLDAHATQVRTETPAQGLAALRLTIPNARRATRRPAPIEREVVYDFELLSKARSAGMTETRLQDLTFVVFDTETTGLSPSTDEIVQIAAVRIVNGRRVRGEVLETLVDPERPIPQASTDVHGITDDMVKGAPTIAEVGRRFHDFARGAVLVAHNAPFDLEFLRRHEARMGVRFDHPVLDTLLLSALIYGRSETHSLDALATRLGIDIPEEARHTAIGDTIATADAFLKLVAMLEARGLATFGAVLAELRRHGELAQDRDGGRL